MHGTFVTNVKKKKKKKKAKKITLFQIPNTIIFENQFTQLYVLSLRLRPMTSHIVMALKYIADFKFVLGCA